MKTALSTASWRSLWLACAVFLTACGGGTPADPETAPVTYTVSTTPGAGGTIDPASAQVQVDASTSFTLVPDAGYVLAEASGCGGTADMATGRYTTAAVSADCTVSARFAALPAANVQVSGLALDATGRSLAGVQAYNRSGVLATSDAQGRLSFSLPPDAAGSVRLRKAGHTQQTVMLSAQQGRADFVGTLGRSNLPVTVNIAGPVTLTGASGASVSLAPGSVVNRQGQPVSGDIQVGITPVDVSDDAALKVFPGSYSALDASGALVPILMPYGTMEVQLTQGDEPLNLAPGATAAIEIPIFVTQHPDGRPITEGQEGGLVWSLDEDTGLWQLEGTGVVVAAERSPTGLALRTQVSHFSWFNFDYGIGGDGIDNGDGTFSQPCEVRLNFRNLPPDFDGVYGQFESTDAARPPMIRILSAPAFEDKVLEIPENYVISVEARAFRHSERVVRYTASARFSCADQNGVDLNFTALPTPLIQDYGVAVLPVFELNAAGQHEVVSNLARIDWNVVGHTALNLIEAELPLNIPLGVAQGSVDVALQAPAGPASNLFTFTLLASNRLGELQLQETRAYIAEATPLVTDFAYYFWPSRPAIVGWRVEGADEVNVGTVPIGTPASALTYLPGLTGLSGNEVAVPTNLLPNQGVGHELVMEFKNQYGSTYRAFVFGQCIADPDTDSGCAETD